MQGVACVHTGFGDGAVVHKIHHVMVSIPTYEL